MRYKCYIILLTLFKGIVGMQSEDVILHNQLQSERIMRANTVASVIPDLPANRVEDFDEQRLKEQSLREAIINKQKKKEEKSRNNSIHENFLAIIQRPVEIDEKVFTFNGKFSTQDRAKIRSAIQEAEEAKLDELKKSKQDGANINYVRKYKGSFSGWDDVIYKENALSLALEGPVYPFIVKWLLENGAQPNATKVIQHKKGWNIEESTPLMQLAKVWVSRNTLLDGIIVFPGDLYSDNFECLKTVCIDLLHYGADVNKKDHSKKTVIDQLNKVSFGFEKPMLDVFNNEKEIAVDGQSSTAIPVESSQSLKSDSSTDVELVKSLNQSRQIDNRIGIRIALPFDHIDKPKYTAPRKKKIISLEESKEVILELFPEIPKELPKPLEQPYFRISFNTIFSSIAGSIESVFTKSSNFVGSLFSKIRFW